MPNTTKPNYWPFYLEGRGERLLRKMSEVDMEALAKKAMESDDSAFASTVLAACQAVVKPLESGKLKRRWIAEHDEEITEAGVDADLAFAAWLRGRIAEFSFSVEHSVLHEIAEDLELDEGGDDDEDEDDEDED